jgi:hypothetical protein
MKLYLKEKAIFETANREERKSSSMIWEQIVSFFTKQPLLQQAITARVFMVKEEDTN